jgi:peptidoglycan/LPS O-acetylase OafA/YrhL
MGRLKLIDGLRGIAAVAVMLYHLLSRTPASWLGARGYLGVAIFFVLSGFVISMVVGERTISASFLGRFALRRAVRLDIPYWTSIAVGVALMVLAARAGLVKVYPTAPQLLAHLFYLQEILGYEEISPIYWTLCLEVQFYLSLILILWAAQALRQRLGSPGFLLAMLLSILLSVLAHAGVLHSPRGLMFPYWWAFAAGAMCYWASARLIPAYYPWATLVILAASALAQHGDWRIVSGLTAALLLWAVKKGTMGSWLADPVSQFLGRTSYSLYLLHGFIGWSAQSLALRYLNVWASLAVGLAASLISAYVGYRLIERPSILLSHRVRVVDAAPVAAALRAVP